jgi:hypothetical protein
MGSKSSNSLPNQTKVIRLGVGSYLPSCTENSSSNNEINSEIIQENTSIH